MAKRIFKITVTKVDCKGNKTVFPHELNKFEFEDFLSIKEVFDHYMEYIRLKKFIRRDYEHLLLEGECYLSGGNDHEFVILNLSESEAE